MMFAIETISNFWHMNKVLNIATLKFKNGFDGLLVKRVKRENDHSA